MKIRFYGAGLALATAGIAVTHVSAPAQGERPPVGLKPGTLIRPKPAEPLPAETNRIPLASLLARKSEFRPLTGTMTLDSAHPLGPSGGLFGGNVGHFDFISGEMSFVKKYGNVGVYFRPTAPRAAYVATFLIEVVDTGPLHFTVSGEKLSPKGIDSSTANAELKKGIHRLAAPIEAGNGDFVFAQIMAYDDAIGWKLKSVTVTKT